MLAVLELNITSPYKSYKYTRQLYKLQFVHIIARRKKEKLENGIGGQTMH